MLTGNPNGSPVRVQLGAVSGKIQELKQAVQNLASREADLKKLQAEADSLREQLIERINQMESEVVEAIAMAVQEVEQDTAATEALRQEKSILESDLERKEEVIRAREATISELEEKLAAVTQGIEGKLEEKTKLREIQRWLNVLSEQLAVFTGEKTIALSESEVVAVNEQERGTGPTQTPVQAETQVHPMTPTESQTLSPAGFKVVLEK